MLFSRPIRFINDFSDVNFWVCGWLIKCNGDFFADETHHAGFRSNAFNFLTTVTLRKLNFCSFFGFGWLLLQKYSREHCSTRPLYSDNMALYHGNLFHVADFWEISDMSEETNPPDKDSRTRCRFIRGNLMYLNNSLRQNFCISEDEMFFQLPSSCDHMSR